MHVRFTVNQASLYRDCLEDILIHPLTKQYNLMPCTKIPYRIKQANCVNMDGFAWKSMHFCLHFHPHKHFKFPVVVRKHTGRHL